MPSWDTKWDDLARLVALFERHRLDELVLEEKGLKLSLKARGTAPVAEPEPAEVSEAEPVGAAAPEAREAAAGPPAGHATIAAPMVGVFYRAPRPDAPSFIEEGEEIEVGQTIGLIEAMKVYSEIPSEVAGRVVAVVAKNGQLIQQGDTLVIVDTGG
ncbi:MAG: acetyl-CoA carboxylase, biotin carboxyl carrier protein [Armatimonadetes bacterium]|nr:acetyl-CoA carboxylase, biotin carboxyl carrier protein [Armatimonadota bacterium]